MAVEPGVHEKQDGVLKDPEKMNEETKAEFLKRRAAEQKVIKKNNKVLKEWYSLSAYGGKLLKRVLKANGNIYSFFMFNIKKNKEIFEKHYKGMLLPSDYRPTALEISELKSAKRK